MDRKQGKIYAIWMRNCPDNGIPGKWRRTSHTVKAASDKDAQSRMRRKFKAYGLSCCSIVAALDGIDINGKEA